jgi:nucleotide-binding universal stress UspA family protein
VKKVVVGVDGSEGSRLALRWALDEARRRALPLNVVMAWQDPVLSTVPLYGVEPQTTDLQAEWEEHLLGILEAEELTEVTDVEITTRVVESPPAPALLAAAGPDDILVVGTRGRGAFSGMLLGSVSQHCVTHAPCPVVVVPGQHEGKGRDR